MYSIKHVFRNKLRKVSRYTKEIIRREKWTKDMQYNVQRKRTKWTKDMQYNVQRKKDKMNQGHAI